MSDWKNWGYNDMFTLRQKLNSLVQQYQAVIKNTPEFGGDGEDLYAKGEWDTLKSVVNDLERLLKG